MYNTLYPQIVNTNIQQRFAIVTINCIGLLLLHLLFLVFENFSGRQNAEYRKTFNKLWTSGCQPFCARNPIYLPVFSL